MVQIKRKHGRVAPRSWFSLFWGHQGLFAILALVLLLLLTFLSVRALIKTKRFESDGIIAHAQIVSKRTKRNDDSTSYYATLAFTPTVGPKVTRERNVGRVFYNTTGIGTFTEIRYLAEDPAGFEYYVGKNRVDKNVAQILALVAGLAGLAVLWFVGMAANMAILARRYGRIGVGEVMSVIEGKDEDGHPTGKGQLVWRDEKGGRGIGLNHDMNVLGRYKHGDNIRIFVRDGESWWEGDVGPRKVR